MRYETPRAVIDAYARSELTEDKLVDALGDFDYVESSAPHLVPEWRKPTTPGTREEIVDAHTAGLIDNRVYRRVFTRLVEQGLGSVHEAVLAFNAGALTKQEFIAAMVAFPIVKQNPFPTDPVLGFVGQQPRAGRRLPRRVLR